MSKVLGIVLLATVFVATGLAASSPVEVLYVAQLQATSISLVTYNVNPETAVAEQVGAPVTVGAKNIDPVTVNGRHLIYVWNGTDVWMHPTNAQGVPESEGSQHLKFNFGHQVNSFAVDPDGKFAYAGMIWFGTGYNNYASVVLFTIDQSTGMLTNTNRVVARYGPDPYTGLTGFSFRSRGGRLYAGYFDNGPYTCIIGYDFYPVDQSSGALGGLMPMFYGQADCIAAGAVAITDTLAANASACCGPGSGGVGVNQTFGGQNIGCDAPMLAFCGDDVAQLNLDPANENLFFGDLDTGTTYIGHLDFTTSQLIESGSTIAGVPPLYFSPDSRLVYAVNASDIGIYTLQSSSGTLGASSSVADGGKVSIATTTLP
jgi:hypothetical protein